MIVGGAEIYRLALPRADKVVLTRVQGQVSGDVVFDLDLLAGWQEVETAQYAAEGGNSHAFTVVELTPTQKA
jgi:dihydrofolate reductase